MTSELWRARMYAAMHVLRVLAKMRNDYVDTNPALFEVRKELERGIVRRQAFESSGSVSKVLQQGEVAAAELSVELWRSKLQDTAMSYNEAVKNVKGEIESAMQVELDLLESTCDESTIDDPYLEQQRLVMQRAGRAKMEVFCKNVEVIEETSGETMGFLRGMKEQLCKIDVKLDAIQEALLAMDVKLDKVLDDTRMILSNQQAALRQEAEHHQSLLDVLHRDTGFYMYVAIQPPPVVAGCLANQLQFRQLMDDFEGGLNENRSNFFKEFAYPICLNDGNASVVRADLAEGKVHTLVWCATGDGWEAKSDVEPIGLDALLQAKLPKLIIVVLKYGAQQAAKRLSQRAMTGTVVIYMQADMLGEGGHGEDNGRNLFRLIAPIVWELHKDPTSLDKAVERLREQSAQALKDPQRRIIGCYGAVSSKGLKWKPSESSQAEWVLNDAAGMLTASRTNLINPRASLARQKVFSCDLDAVENLKLKLQDSEGTHRVYVIMHDADDSRKDETSRCMAVVLAVCSSFVLARGRFDLVYLIETENDLHRVNTIVTSSNFSHNNTILLWAHLQDSTVLADAECGMTSSWTSEMTAGLIQIMSNNINAHIILTNDDSKTWGSKDVHIDIAIEIQKAWMRPDETADISNNSALEGFLEFVSLTPLVENIVSCPHHEEIKIFFSVRRGISTDGGRIEGDFDPCDLLDLFSSKSDILQQSLKDSLPGSRPIAAMYHDTDDQGCPALLVRIAISDVAYLHELRDIVLGGLFSNVITDRITKAIREELPHIGNVAVNAVTQGLT